MSVGRVSLLALAIPCVLGCTEQTYQGRAFDAPLYAPYAPPPPYAYAAPPAQAWSFAGDGKGAWRALAFAHSRMGLPYCWGGNGPHCYDCSGLTRAAWAFGGKAIPRTSEDQVSRLPAVAMNAVQPGDILWRPGHVGIYAGQGFVIAATHTGDFVRYQRADHFVRAVRP